MIKAIIMCGLAATKNPKEVLEQILSVRNNITYIDGKKLAKLIDCCVSINVYFLALENSPLRWIVANIRGEQVVASDEGELVSWLKELKESL